MGIMGREVIFDNSDYYRAALLVKVHYKILMKARVFILSQSEYQLLANVHEGAGSSILLHREDKDVMFVTTNTDRWVYLVKWYSFAYKQSIDVTRVNNFIGNIQSEEHNRRAHLESIEYYEALIQKEDTGYHSLKFFDFKEFHKVARAQKVGVYKDGESYRMNFKNVSCGNETEGHINYKAVNLWVNSKFQLTKCEFVFSKFVLNSEWFSHTVHPHISGRSGICYGNRKSDFQLYRDHLAYEFYIDLISETVRSYNPDNPYVSLSEVRSQLAVYEEVLRGNKTLEEMPIAERSRRIVEMSTLDECSRCGNYMMAGRCNNLECVACPDHIEICSACNNPMEATWEEHQRLNTYRCEEHDICERCSRPFPRGEHCVNANCFYNPAYESTCGVCSQAMEVTGYDGQTPNRSCATNLCTGNPNSTQYVEDCPECGDFLYRNLNTYRWYCGNCGHELYNEAGEDISEEYDMSLIPHAQQVTEEPDDVITLENVTPLPIDSSTTTTATESVMDRLVHLASNEVVVSDDRAVRGANTENTREQTIQEFGSVIDSDDAPDDASPLDGLTPINEDEHDR